MNSIETGFFCLQISKPTPPGNEDDAAKSIPAQTVTSGTAEPVNVSQSGSVFGKVKLR